MITYIATDINDIVSAYTESEARQNAEDILGYGHVVSFKELSS
ncbi:hypothetical protein [Thalassotalea piscium]|uniref:Uncharacterized protein n=1 Tax=Thalassotalea piscium TaxID=1230533 RepID=A0A7X0NJV7_9GAMM|nr:hypothetical protein [Thalassotalea piscium]MBB6544765.1 hypothetical protein [Thalassotalea piscium]